MHKRGMLPWTILSLCSGQPVHRLATLEVYVSKIIVVSLAAYATFLRVFPFYAVALEIKKSL